MGEDVRVERFEVGAAADDRALDGPGVPRRVDAGQVDVVDGRGKAQADAVGAFEIGGQGGDGFAGIDAELGRAPQAALEVVRSHGPAASEDSIGVEECDLVPEVGGESGEFLVDGVFVVGVGQVQRAGFGDPEAGFRGEVAPDFAGAQGALVHLAGGLADGPDHAEVAD